MSNAMGHATTAITGDLAAVLRRHMDALARYAPRARRGDERGIHQARVVSRRLREALPIVGAAGGGEVPGMRADLRRVTVALGELREMDVARRVFDAETRTHQWPVASVDRVRQFLTDERARRRRRMVVRLARVDVDRLTARIAAIASAIEAAPRLGDGPLIARLRQRARRLLKAVRGIGPLYAPDALHALRLAAKKMRYTLEVARDGSRAPVGREIAKLKALQELLGRLHDLQILQHEVRVAAAQPAGDWPAIRTLEKMAATFEAECRELHAKCLRMLPGIEAVATRIGDEAAVGRHRRGGAQMIRMQWTTATRARGSRGPKAAKPPRAASTP
jgi:CHAD domain-containing protein